MILRICIFFIFISISTLFLFLGYKDLKDINFVNVNKITEKKKSELKEIYKDNIIIDFEKPLIEENFELNKSKIIENEIVLVVKKNDTFSELVNPYISNNQIKQKIINSINKDIDLKKLNIGQKIYLYVSEKNIISKIVIPLNFNTDLVVEKNINSEYFIKKINIPITTDLISKKYSILNSLFEDGLKAKVPLSILTEVIRLYSFDIDFQRDIRKENQLEIMYKVFHNENRKITSYGEIQYANLILEKSNLEYFLFKSPEGYSDYFNKEGKNVKKTLMKTPLDGAKLSSGFGLRKHPILGYNKKHLGVDFAAPKGTPVYAAGNGKIEYAARNGGYGKYIRIRHNSSYKTAYAHLNRFNKGISVGVRVSQGQTIGYVGSTGRSTGPHLHYEVIYQGKPINPMKMKLSSEKILKENELIKFKELSKLIYADFLFNLFE